MAKKYNPKKHRCNIHYIALRKGLSIPSETMFEYLHMTLAVVGTLNSNTMFN